MALDSWLNVAGGQLFTGLFIFARFGGLLFSAPLVGGKSVPNHVRVGLSGMLALVLTPVVGATSIDSVAAFVLGMSKEVLLGLMLGWTATLLFSSVQMAGEWLDLHSGFQVAQVLNPVFDTQNALLGNFKYVLAGLAFLGTGGYAIVIRAAANSLAVSPPGVLRLGVGSAGDWTGLLVKAMWLAVQLAAPVAAALFLAEVAVGLMNRALPQLNVMLLTLPVKALVALCALGLSVPVLARVMEALFAGLGSDMTRLLHTVGQ